MTQTSCEASRRTIEHRRFIGWRGLPAGCTPAALFGVAFDGTWGVAKLGDQLEPARMHVLDVPGYYRPMLYVRDGHVETFDGMNPELDGDWASLSVDLGEPDATLDFVHGTTAMPGGERVYARRGITVFLNPANKFVLYVSVFAPTTVDAYVKRLRLRRDKPMGRG